MSFTALREDALRLIANGKTAAELAGRAADPSCYDHYRTAAGLRAHMGEHLAKFITHLVPGDDLASEMTAFDDRLASAMAELEGLGWTQESARAALGLTEPRKPAAA
jgi:hypothetical protein